jgi:VWFA-related protein
MKRVLVLIACILAAAIAGAGQPTAPTLTVVPGDGAYVSGPLEITVSVPPAAPGIAQLTIYADGRLVCSRKEPPWQCPWNAGAGVREHQVRITAVLADGQRLTKVVRTRAAEYADQVDVEAVQVPVVVTDGKGQFVRGLKGNAFRVLEDGVPQAITHFGSEETAVEVVVGVDISQSLRGFLPAVKSAVREFLGALRPKDSVTLLAFNDQVFTVAERTVEPKVRLQKLGRLGAWGSTALYDAMARGLERLAAQTGRKALVIFTDGEDNTSAMSIDGTEQALGKTDATIYLVGQGTALKDPRFRAILDRLAGSSGGRTFYPDNEAALHRAFADVSEELASQYLLGYVPRHTAERGRWRTITVQMRDPEWKVRHRVGYQVR